MPDKFYATAVEFATGFSIVARDLRDTSRSSPIDERLRAMMDVISMCRCCSPTDEANRGESCRCGLMARLEWRMEANCFCSRR